MRARFGWWSVGICCVLSAGCGGDGEGTNEPVGASTQAVNAAQLEVIASGLNSPRGLTVDRDGTILVAEAGLGGDSPCVLGGDGQPRCFGLSGAVAAVGCGGELRRVVTGLPSLATTNHLVAIGPHDVVLDRGRMHIVTGLALNPGVRTDPTGLGTVSPALAMLLEARPRRTGEWPVHTVADVGAFELAHDPALGSIESNPFGVVARRGGWLVTDAAGNDLLRVSPRGEVSLVAVFPSRQVGDSPRLMEPVPTAIAEGPDNAVYVGEFTGFPFPKGEARVYRVDADAEPAIFATGFTNIIDLAFERDGSMLVLELATNGAASGDRTGALWRVEADGTKQLVVSSGLVAPGGVAVGNHGEIYVSNCGICGPGAGTVVRVTE
jgi:hypothetical protein